MTSNVFSPRAPQITADHAPSLRRRAWLAMSGAAAAVLGVAPHVLHHAGPLAGAAVLGGVGGSLLFGAVGFVLAIPFLLRIHRRCDSWAVPGAILALMAIVFALSTFVVGPALSGGSSDSTTSAPQSAPARDGGHASHH